ADAVKQANASTEDGKHAVVLADSTASAALTTPFVPPIVLARSDLAKGFRGKAASPKRQARASRTRPCLALRARRPLSALLLLRPREPVNPLTRRRLLQEIHL